MDFDDGSTSDGEDETDSLALQYRITDRSLLGTAVFIKHIDIDPGDYVMEYIHPAQPEEPKQAKPALNMRLLTIVLAVVSLITFSLYTSSFHS